MIKFKYLLLALLFVPITALAQFTAVTATITDSDSQTWNNGTWTATLINPNPQVPPSINGTNLTTAQMNLSGTMSGSGVITQSMASNAVVQPLGTYWQFTICPNASVQCSTATASVSGSSQNISTTLSSKLSLLRFPASATSYGYSDAEVSPKPNPGGMYFNVTSLVQRVWTGAVWVNNSGGSNFITSLSTVGTSGAAAVNLGNLNIPNYATGGGGGGSANVKYISQLGCAAQDGSFQTRTGTDDTACINAFLATASNTNRVVLIQDPGKVSAVSGILGPEKGTWEIDGSGGGWYSVDVTNCTIASGTATFATKVQSLDVGRVVTVGGFGACAALNGTRITVLASGLTTTQFKATVSAGDVASSAENGKAAYLFGSGFVMLPAFNDTKPGIANTAYCAATVPGGANYPEQAASVTLKDFVFDDSGTSADPSNFCSSITIFGANHVTISGLVLFQPTSFNIAMSDVSNVVIENTNILDQFPGIVPRTFYNDGIHFGGNVNNAQISNVYLNTGDDPLALNTNEFYCGPITNIQAVNVEFDGINSGLRIDAPNHTLDGCPNSETVSHVHLVNYNGSFTAVNGALAYLGNGYTTDVGAKGVTDFTWSDSTVTGPSSMLVSESIDSMALQSFKWIEISNGATGEWFRVANASYVSGLVAFNNVTQERTTAGTPGVPIGFGKGIGGSSDWEIQNLIVNNYNETCSDFSNPGNCHLPIATFLHDAAGYSIQNIMSTGFNLSNITTFTTLTALGPLYPPTVIPGLIEGGINGSAILGKAATGLYNTFTMNGNTADGTRLGFVAGAPGSGDNNWYSDTPTGGTFYNRIGNSAVATLKAISAGVGQYATGSVVPHVYTVGTLPSAATLGAGAIVLVSDATTFTVGTCTGGGSDYMVAVSNGTTWSCH